MAWRTARYVYVRGQQHLAEWDNNRPYSRCQLILDFKNKRYGQSGNKIQLLVKPVSASY